MSDRAGWITEEKLLSNNAGTTSRQLGRWREAGLIPYDVAGRGRGRGVETSYPPEAVERVQRIQRLLKKIRNLDKVAFILWLSGCEVSLDAVRRVLQESVKNHIQMIEPLVSNGELSEHAWDMIDASEHQRARSPFRRRLRQSLSGERMPELMEGVLSLICGVVPAPRWDGDIAPGMTAVDRLATIYPVPLSGAGPIAPFQTVAIALHPNTLERAVFEASDGMLKSAQRIVDPHLRALLQLPEFDPISIQELALVVALVLSLLRLESRLKPAQGRKTV